MIFKTDLCMFLVTLVVFKADSQVTPFSCQGRPNGYYADTSTGCEVYHMCDGLGRKFSYRCPSDTLFQQRMLICDHWYMVNCSRSEQDYSANLLIGQRDTPFVNSQFERTPRPDLIDLSNPVNLQNYKERERKRKMQSDVIENVVGEDENTIRITADESQYFPPSHWSTEYPSETTTKSPSDQSKAYGGRSQMYFRTSYNTVQKLRKGAPEKSIDYASINRNENHFFDPLNKAYQSHKGERHQPDLKVNFPSSFKATTPVYPKEVLGVDMAKFYGTYEELPDGSQANDGVPTNAHPESFSPTEPKQTDQSNEASQQGLPNPNFKVNFPSGFKATTPVYPKEVVGVDLGKFYDTGDSLEQQEGNAGDVVVNFQSNYKGTTPVYPKEVVGVDLNKFSGSEEVPPAPQPVDSVNFQSNFRGTTPVYPKSVDPTSPRPDEAGLLPPHVEERQKEVQTIQTNFGSNFKGTTPVYPRSVEATSPNPDDFGLLPPKDDRAQDRSSITDRQFIEGFDTPRGSFNKRNFRKPNKLDILLEGEDVEESVLKNTFTSKQLNEYMMNPDELKELRGQWHIPDFDFPLETVNRPSYETVFSSYKSDDDSEKSSR